MIKIKRIKARFLEKWVFYCMLKTEGTQPADRELFTMNKIVEPTLLKTSIRYLVGITSRRLDDAFSAATTSVKVHTTRGLQNERARKRGYSIRGIMSDVTDFESNFIYFVCIFVQVYR